MEKFLLQEKTFINSKSKLFSNEICQLLAIMNRNSSFKKILWKFYYENMFKYNGFRELKNFIRDDVASPLEEAVTSNNLTDSEISSICNDDKKAKYKSKAEAMLLSIMYLFIPDYSCDIGAGDIVAATWNKNGLLGDTKNYDKIMTSIYNELIDGQLPSSIFHLPELFVLLDFQESNAALNIDKYNDGIMFMFNKFNHLDLNISFESVINYHALWMNYLKGHENFTLYCPKDCYDHKNFIIHSHSIGDDTVVNKIRNKPGDGRIISGNVISPPCEDKQLQKTMKIEIICNLLDNISQDQTHLLSLMKFKKQSPVIFEDPSEHALIFKRGSSALSKFN